MQTRELSRSGLQVSALGLDYMGAWNREGILCRAAFSSRVKFA